MQARKVSMTLGTILVTACLAILTGSSTGWAIDYDLKTSGVWATPNPLQCPSRINAQLLILGEKDHEIECGDVKIDVEFQMDGGAWNPVGDIAVCRQESDTPFLRFKVWPNDFDSNPNNSVEFRPTRTATYRFRATSSYSRDQDSSNNARTSSSYSAGQICVPQGCWLTSSGLVICPLPDPLKEIKEAFDDRIRQVCKKYPKLCPRPPFEVDPCERYPRLCPVFGGGSDPFCGNFPELCPWFGVVEVLFDDRVNGLKLAISTKSGKLVAKMQKLRRPIKDGKGVYTQRLRFLKSKDETYYLTFWPGNRTKFNKNLPFPVRATPLPNYKY